MESRLTTAVILPEQVARVDQCLQMLLDKSIAGCAMLLDHSGQIVAKRGDRFHSESVPLGALIAGSFASAREIARLLGEEQFQTLFQQGRRQHVLTIAVNRSWLLVVVFDKKTSVGLVRVLCGQAAQELSSILAEVCQQPELQRASLATGFGRLAAKAIDDLFEGA